MCSVRLLYNGGLHFFNAMHLDLRYGLMLIVFTSSSILEIQLSVSRMPVRNFYINPRKEVDDSSGCLALFISECDSVLVN